MKKSKEFLRQLYHGSIDEMLLEFIKNNELSAKEIEILLKKVNKQNWIALLKMEKILRITSSESLENSHKYFWKKLVQIK